MTAGRSVGTAWVLLHPNDVVTFRDGRPFAPGVAAMGRTTMARPSSVAGAVGALFGAGARPRRLVGPVLVHLGRGRPRVVLPTPADVVVDEDGRPGLLRPSAAEEGADPSPATAFPPGLVTDLDPASAMDGDDAGGSRGIASSSGSGGVSSVRPLAGDGDSPGGVVASTLIADYLDGDAEALLDELAVAVPGSEGPLRLEPRLGIARRLRTAAGDGRVTVPGFLYQEEFWRPAVDAVEGRGATTAGLAFATRVEFDGIVPSPLSRMVRLGGEARQAEARVVPAGEPDAPVLPDLVDTSAGRVLLYLITPAIFADGWRPSLPSGCTLVAACTTGPEVIAAIAGDTGRPRPLRWAVGAGSVYFLHFDDPAEATGFARTVHGECLDQAEDWMRTAGFGACLVGRW